MSTLKTNNIQHVDRSEPSILIDTSGSVSIACTLTYEDVTSVDSVGIITARGLNIFGNTTGLQVASGISTFQAITGTTLTLTNDLFMSDGDQIELGTDNDLKIYHSGFNYIESHNDSEIHINANTGGSVENMAKFKPNGAVELYHNNTKTFETTSTGVKTLGDVSLRTSSNTQTIIYDESDGQIEFLDNIKASFGTGGDLLIHHNGSVNVIDAATSAALSFRYGGSEQFFIGNAEFKGGDDKVIKLGTGDDLRLFHDGSNTYVQAYDTGDMYMGTIHNADVIIRQNSQNRYKFAAGGFNPMTDNVYDLGNSSLRWRNLYTGDLQLSNKGSKNDVDGTWGIYTIQEGESDLFLINNRSGKKYKFNLTEVS